MSISFVLGGPLHIPGIPQRPAKGDIWGVWLARRRFRLAVCPDCSIVHITVVSPERSVFQGSQGSVVPLAQGPHDGGPLADQGDLSTAAPPAAPTVRKSDATVSESRPRIALSAEFEVASRSGRQVSPRCAESPSKGACGRRARQGRIVVVGRKVEFRLRMYVSAVGARRPHPRRPGLLPWRYVSDPTGTLAWPWQSKDFREGKQVESSSTAPPRRLRLPLQTTMPITSSFGSREAWTRRRRRPRAHAHAGVP